MLKRKAELTPSEKKTKRRRLVFGGSFAAFLVSILFLVAYTGINTQRALKSRLPVLPSILVEGTEPYLTPNAVARLDGAAISSKLPAGELLIALYRIGDESTIHHLAITPSPGKTISAEDLTSSIRTAFILAPEEVIEANQHPGGYYLRIGSLPEGYSESAEKYTRFPLPKIGSVFLDGDSAEMNQMAGFPVTEIRFAADGTGKTVSTIALGRTAQFDTSAIRLEQLFPILPHETQQASNP